MTISEIPVELYLPEPKTPRSQGVHVSNIIRCIAQESGILKPEWAEEISLVDVRTITDPVAIVRINMGLAWEAHYIPMLGDVLDHPGELQYDGIYMSPDGESVSVIVTDRNHGMQLVLHEVKLTYKSINTVCPPRSKPLENQWMWMAQCKSYCKAMDTRFCNLHVLFACGDYSYPIRPIPKRWAIEFTQAEIDENWDLIRDYMKHKLSEESDQLQLGL
jgi:hypothetical protein